MVDFHTHILPNIDDGSKSVEETFALIKEAEKAGFDAIISTSHYIEQYYNVPNRDRKIWLDALSSKFDEQNINMKLYLGSEIYITEKIVELIKEEKAATINNTKYVLFELPMNAKPFYLNDVIFEIMKNDMKPILAHPERYSFIQKNPNEIYDLIQKGVLMQSNYASFIGYYGNGVKFTARKLLKNNMIHFLGSDVHTSKTIYPKIPKILEELKKLIGEEKVYELTEKNPKLALNNEKIKIRDPEHIKMTFKDKFFMNGDSENF